MKKFRVWDSERKMYINPRQCLIDGNGNFFYKDDVNGQLYNWTEDFVVEWCVGKLYDGTEIYKNDIVREWEVIVGDCIHNYQVRNDAWTYISEEAIKAGKLTKNLNEIHAGLATDANGERGK